MCSHPEQEAGLAHPSVAPVGMDGCTDPSDALVNWGVRKMKPSAVGVWHCRCAPRCLHAKAVAKALLNFLVSFMFPPFHDQMKVGQFGHKLLGMCGKL